MTSQPNDCQSEPVLARAVALLDQSALLESGEQPRRRRLMEPEPARELDDPCLSLHLAESDQQRRGPID